MSKKVIGLDYSFMGDTVEIPFEEGVGEFCAGENIIFKDEDGNEEYAQIKYLNVNSLQEDKIMKKGKILRKATMNDTQKVESHREQAKEALRICKKLVDKHQIDMQVFRGTYSLDGSKICFIFTAEDRVDFRLLVKDLALMLKKQIHLRQVGPRDRARMSEGFGRCGRLRCSSSFLKNLESINMEMVRVQGLEGRGSSKLSGACGKLLCSLKYEVDVYRDLRKGLPEPGSQVKLKGADSNERGVIAAIDVLNQKIKVVYGRDKFTFANASDIDKIMKDGEWKSFSLPKEALFQGKEPVSDEGVETFVGEIISNLKN